jgi:hypothetical protein
MTTLRGHRFTAFNAFNTYDSRTPALTVRLSASGGLARNTDAVPALRLPRPWPSSTLHYLLSTLTAPPSPCARSLSGGLRASGALSSHRTSPGRSQLSTFNFQLSTCNSHCPTLTMRLSTSGGLARYPGPCAPPARCPRVAQAEGQAATRIGAACAGRSRGGALPLRLRGDLRSLPYYSPITAGSSE